MNIKTPVKRIFRTETEWKALIDEWQLSGKPVAEFCKEKKISGSGFYYWRNRFCPTPQKAIAKRERTQTNTFVPVVISTPNITSSKLILSYPNGCQLQISSIDLNTLKLLNQAMGV
jgi:hypothetical protein